MRDQLRFRGEYPCGGPADHHIIVKTNNPFRTNCVKLLQAQGRDICTAKLVTLIIEPDENGFHKSLKFNNDSELKSFQNKLLTFLPNNTWAGIFEIRDYGWTLPLGHAVAFWLEEHEDNVVHILDSGGWWDYAEGQHLLDIRLKAEKTFTLTGLTFVLGPMRRGKIGRIRSAPKKYGQYRSTFKSSPSRYLPSLYREDRKRVPIAPGTPVTPRDAAGATTPLSTTRAAFEPGHQLVDTPRALPPPPGTLVRHSEPAKYDRKDFDTELLRRRTHTERSRREGDIPPSLDVIKKWKMQLLDLFSENYRKRQEIEMQTHGQTRPEPKERMRRASLSFVIYMQSLQHLDDLKSGDIYLRQRGQWCWLFSNAYLGYICERLQQLDGMPPRLYEAQPFMAELYRGLLTGSHVQISNFVWNQIIEHGLQEDVTDKGERLESGGFAWRFLMHMERAATKVLQAPPSQNDCNTSCLSSLKDDAVADLTDKFKIATKLEQ